MAIPIEMPRLSDTMEEGTLVKWRVKVGDAVASGDHLADVETDKATMELQAFDDGTVAKINVNEGQTVPVGKVILILAQEGEDADQAASADAESKPTESAAPAGDPDAARPEPEPAHTQVAQETETAPPAAPAAASTSTASGGRVKVSPVARSIAEEKGIDLSTIKGTGPGGRIIKRDVLEATPGGAPTKAAPAPAGPPRFSGVDVPALESKTLELSNMRKTIARRLVESHTGIPSFNVSMPIDMDALLELRKTLNDQLEAQGVKLSVGDFVTRAVALACVAHPVVNSSWADNAIEQHGTVNVGIAVALPAERGGGLIVPVLRDVQNKGLRQISAETKAIANKARTQGLPAEEMAGGTITISNLGMFGVSHFTAIINPPQAAILAVGSALEQPVVRDGQLTVGHQMTATLAADHRVLDGAVAAEYLTTLKQLLENPAAILV